MRTAISRPPTSARRGGSASASTAARTGRRCTTCCATLTCSSRPGASPRSSRRGSEGGALRLLHGLDFEQHLDLVTDRHAAALDHLVPNETEVAAIELRLCAEADALAAPWILPRALVGRVERHFLRDSADGQVAHDFELRGAARDARAREGDFGEVLRVEEIGAAEVGIALFGARIDARRLDGGPDRGARRITARDDDLALDVGEAALHRRDHEVLHGELDERVRGIDLPRGAGGGCLGGGHGNAPLTVAKIILNSRYRSLEFKMIHVAFVPAPFP